MVASALGSAAADAWPLTGRDADLAAVVDAARAGRGVVVGGPPGCGRTRLLAEAAAQLTGSGWTVVTVKGSRALAGRAYAALAPLLPDGLDDERSDAARRVLDALPAGARHALVVDDAQDLDDPSAAAVHQVAAGGTVVLAGVRATAEVPESITGLWKDGLADRIDLAPLPTDAVTALLAAVLGDPVDGAAVRQLVERAGGSTVLLRELVRSALDAGVLVDVDRLWRLTGPIPVSARLVELVAARLADLDEPARRAFELVALGEPLLIDAVSALVDPDLLDRIEARGRFVVDGGDGTPLRIRCTTPLVAEVVRAGLPTLRGRRLRVELADAIDQAAAAIGRGTGRDRVTALRLRIEAGVPVEPAAAVTAARRAWSAFQFPLARTLGEAAIAAGGGFDAELVVAQVDGQLGEGEAAERRLAALQERATTDEQLAVVAATRTENLVLRLADAAKANQVAAAAEGAITDPTIRAELAVKRALVLHSAGDSVGALEIVLPRLDRLEGESLLSACFVAATGASLTGQLQVAYDACERGATARLVPPSPWDPAILDLNRCMILGLVTDLPAAMALAEDAYDRAIADQALHRQAWFAWARGGLLLTAGRAASAARWCREAAAALAELGQTSSLRLVRNDLARALALLGQADEARATLDAGGEPAEAGAALFGDDGTRLVAEAWTAAAAGDLDRARGLALAAADLHQANGHRLPALHALVDHVRLGGAGVDDRVAELAGHVEGPLSAAYAATVAARPGRGKPTALEAAAEELEALGIDLVAAETFAAAAVRWEKAGDSRAAAAADRRAAAALGRCEGATTPGTRARTRPVLSPREHEVASLAAQGLSNRAIAEQLVLSVRTVETLLQRSYQKLGVDGRAELATGLLAASP